jgi:hypothetical protein
MVEGELRSVVLLEARSVADFTTTEGASDLLGKSLLVTELVQQRLMKQILDILGVIEGGVGGGSLGGLLLVARLTGVDSFNRDFSLASHFTKPIDSQCNLPLKIHRRRKSGREICSFRTAWVRVI